jgi:cell division septation protein DedD
VWFGQRADSQKTPKVCKGEKEPVQASTPVAVKNKQYYYLIIASFNNQPDAKEALRRTKKNGFKKAGIMHSGKNFRVYIGKYESLKEATFIKENLSPTYRDAWILKN